MPFTMEIAKAAVSAVAYCAAEKAITWGFGSFRTRSASESNFTAAEKRNESYSGSTSGLTRSQSEIALNEEYEDIKIIKVVKRNVVLPPNLGQDSQSDGAGESDELKLDSPKLKMTLRKLTEDNWIELLVSSAMKTQLKIVPFVTQELQEAVHRRFCGNIEIAGMQNIEIHRLRLLIERLCLKIGEELHEIVVEIHPCFDQYPLKTILEEVNRRSEEYRKGSDQLSQLIITAVAYTQDFYWRWCLGYFEEPKFAEIGVEQFDHILDSKIRKAIVKLGGWSRLSKNSFSYSTVIGGILIGLVSLFHGYRSLKRGSVMV